MSLKVSCCIVGDVNIDYITDLSHIVLDGKANSCYYNRVMSSVGGNAVFFAESVREAGYSHIAVLCSIGDDIAGSQAREHFDRLGVVAHIMTSKLLTGQVMIIYQPDDRRIMVADRGANMDLRVPEKGILFDIVRQSDMLYVSGYMLLDKNQCKALHTIANVFRAAKKKVLVDMVPHDVWQTRTWQEYIAMCSCADCVAVELSTVSSFHGGSPDALKPEEAAQLLLNDFKFCLVRINDASDFVIADRTHQRIVTVPYLRTEASLRFTDRVIASVMQQYVVDPEVLFNSELWLEKVVKSVKGGV